MPSHSLIWANSHRYNSYLFEAFFGLVWSFFRLWQLLSREKAVLVFPLLVAVDPRPILKATEVFSSAVLYPTVPLVKLASKLAINWWKLTGKMFSRQNTKLSPIYSGNRSKYHLALINYAFTSPSIENWGVRTKHHYLWYTVSHLSRATSEWTRNQVSSE